MTENINFIKDFAYPKREDGEDDFEAKMFKKREFHIYRVPERKKLETYEEVQAYRAANCKKEKLIHANNKQSYQIL